MATFKNTLQRFVNAEKGKLLTPISPNKKRVVNGVLNPSFYLKQYDLSGVVFNSRHGILFHPQVVMTCKHLPLGVGSVAQFMTQAGKVVSRKVIKQQALPDTYKTSIGTTYPELALSLLESSPVSEGVKVHRIATTAELKPYASTLHGIINDAEEEFNVYKFVYFNRQLSPNCEVVYGNKPNDTTADDAWENIVGGDSSSAIICIDDTGEARTLGAVSHWRYNWAGFDGGFAGGMHLPAINTILKGWALQA